MTARTKERVKHVSNITVIVCGIIVSLASSYLVYIGKGASNFITHLKNLPQTEQRIYIVERNDSIQDLKALAIADTLKSYRANTAKRFDNLDMYCEIMLNTQSLIAKKLGIEPPFIPEKLKGRHRNYNRHNDQAYFIEKIK